MNMAVLTFFLFPGMVRGLWGGAGSACSKHDRKVRRRRRPVKARHWQIV